MIWIEPTASYSNASRLSGIGKGRPLAIGKADSAATKRPGGGRISNPDFITVDSSVQGRQIGRQSVDVGIVQFLPEQRHLAFDSRGDDLMNSRVTLVQIVEVGPSSPSASSPWQCAQFKRKSFRPWPTSPMSTSVAGEVENSRVEWPSPGRAWQAARHRRRSRQSATLSVRLSLSL